MAPLNILIIGASIAGPTLATLLLLADVPADQKPHITILERAPKLRTNGQNIDIRSQGFPVIRKLGLESIVRAHTTDEKGVQWVNREGKVVASLPAEASGATSDIEMLRGRLAQICYDCSKRVSDAVQEEGGKGIEYIFGDHVEQLQQNGQQVTVTFARSGEQRDYDLVVGSDGLQSSTRKLAFGEEGEQERVQRLGIYGGFFSMPHSPDEEQWRQPSWRQWFHATGRKGYMVRPHEQRDRTTVFAHVINDDDQRLQDVSRRAPGEGAEAQKELIAEYLRGAGWESERIIEAMMKTDDFYYDMVGQVKMDSWSKGRVVLVGDAAYCASPLSGMGTTLALKGAYNLAGALTRHSTDLPAAFAEYERTTRPLVTDIQKSVPGKLFIFNPNTTWDLWKVETLVSLVSWVKPVASFVFWLKGPRSASVEPGLEEYGFRTLAEYQE